MDISTVWSEPLLLYKNEILMKGVISMFVRKIYSAELKLEIVERQGKEVLFEEQWYTISLFRDVSQVCSFVYVHLSFYGVSKWRRAATSLQFFVSDPQQSA